MGSAASCLGGQVQSESAGLKGEETERRADPNNRHKEKDKQFQSAVETHCRYEMRGMASPKYTLLVLWAESQWFTQRQGDQLRDHVFLNTHSP